MTDKLEKRMADLWTLAAEAEKVAGQQTLTIIADAERALKRAIKRAEAETSEEYERVEFVQNRGPTIEFTGKLLCSTQFQSRGIDTLRIEMEIWETQSGALVATLATEPVGREGYLNQSARIVPRRDDPQAMRNEVMDFFNWEDRARSMARKALGWSFRMEVD